MLRRKRAGVGHRQGRGGSLIPVLLTVLTPVFCLVFSPVFGLAGGGHASLLSGFWFLALAALMLLDVVFLPPAYLLIAWRRVGSTPVRASLPQL